MRRTGVILSATVVLAALLGPASPASADTATLQQLAPLVAFHPAGVFTFSPAGDVTATARFVDVQIPPSPTPNTSTSGCESADFAGFPASSIAILQRGTCTFAVKAANAQAAGAQAVVIFNEGQPGRTDVLVGTLGGPGVTIPVVGTSFAVAQQLFSQFSLILRVTTTVDPTGCDSPPATGTSVGGRNVVIAQPGVVTLGTEGPDVIYGTAGDDRIAGLGGDDLIFGLGGADQLAGGEGADTLCGGAGNDTLSGGGGPDLMSGGADDDDLAGGAGDDTLYGDAGTNRLAGGEGTDTCSASATVNSCEAQTT